MKNKWSKYALKDGKIQSSYLREYSSRSPKREGREASCRNRLLQSGEKQREEEIKLVYRSPVHQKPKIDPTILNDAWVINLNGMEDGNDGINETGKAQPETRKDQEIQSGSSSRSITDMQDVSGKRTRRTRKASDSKKHNDGPQEQKGE